MAKKQSTPLTDDEFESVYRNELYTIDDPRYFCHKTTGSRYFASLDSNYGALTEIKESEDVWNDIYGYRKIAQQYK